MNPCEQVDDNNYTIGIAAFTCLLPLPIMYFVSQPLMTLPVPWMPWAAVVLLMLAPLLTAFTILYHGPWKRDWSRPKRLMLGIPLSLTIVVAEVTMIVALIFPFFVVCCLAFPDVVSGLPYIPSGGQY